MTQLACLSIALAMLCGLRVGAQQYDLRTYSLEQGLPSASVHALCEDTEGYLWVGTDEGAARSDGTRYQVFDAARGMPGDVVTALYSAADGSVWMGCRNGGVARWRNDTLWSHPGVAALPKASITALAMDLQGNVWLGTRGNGLVRLVNDSEARLDTTLGPSGRMVNDLVQDARGRLLALTDSGLFVHADNGWLPSGVKLPRGPLFALFADSTGILVGTSAGYVELDNDLRPLPPAQRFTGSFPIALPDPRVTDLLRTRNGDLWLGTPAGLVHLNKRGGQPQITVIGEANGLGHELVRCVLQDRSGSIWAGTGFGGITKYVSDAFLHFTDRDGLRSRIVSSIHRTRDGLLWLGTVGGGLARWDGNQIRSYDKENGLTDGFVLALGEDEQGHLLVGTATKGLFRMQGERLSPVTLPDGPPVTRVFAIRSDHQQRIWAGTSVGLYVDDTGKGFRSVGDRSLEVHAIVAARDTVWLGTNKGLHFLVPGAALEEPLPMPVVPVVSINSMARDRAGNLWVGTEGHGLYRLHGNRIDSIGPAQGLASRTVELVLLDAYDNVWVGTRRSIHLVELDELQERVLNIHHFGPREGFAGIETFRNACMLDEDSALWFGSVRGATRYDPRRLLEDPYEPLVHITDLRLYFERPDWRPWCNTIGRHGLPLGLELPHDRNHLTFVFTGISLAHPERVRYRYILEGYDPDWSPITELDRVTYSNIPPGDFTFRVMARNGSGVWTEEPVTYAFRISPPFWATLSFRLIAGAMVLLLLAGLVRYRERRLVRDRERLEDMVAKRTRELATEKDRSERLLLNILPASTAEELKTKGTAEARRYEQCTVLFSDFSGFTTFSGNMDSATLVADLDHFFRLFDQLCDVHGLEKIKTIGDAYMCAAGLPEPCTDHAIRAVRMALDMAVAVDRTNAERRMRGQHEWPIRIGLHSGPVVAGVVGEKKFAYDIWGNTVNLASRMESNSESGKVNISGTTYAQVMDEVEVLPRGPIKVKGKGELQMYFVLRMKDTMPNTNNGSAMEHGHIGQG